MFVKANSSFTVLTDDVIAIIEDGLGSFSCVAYDFKNNTTAHLSDTDLFHIHSDLVSKDSNFYKTNLNVL